MNCDFVALVVNICVWLLMLAPVALLILLGGDAK